MPNVSPCDEILEVIKNMSGMGSLLLLISPTKALVISTTEAQHKLALNIVRLHAPFDGTINGHFKNSSMRS